MILTYKVKHNRDFSVELQKAKQIAEYTIHNHVFSSKEVKHVGLKSVIANQVLRKYGRNKNIKQVTNIKLIVPNQGIKGNKENETIDIPSLKFRFEYLFPNNFSKINQIEMGEEYVYVSVTIQERELIPTNKYIGIDLNTTGHIAVLSNPENGKIIKMGKKANHIHTKYKNIRRNLQKKRKYKKVKQIKQRESNIIKDLNNKISHEIIETAIKSNSGIKLEKLTGIINNTKHIKSFNYSLNSWSFNQLQQMIEYKAKLHGIPVIYIEPAYTSKTCSRCNHIGNRNDKQFKCLYCGHVDHADVNAAFNIALRSPSIVRFNIERDILKGNTDIPKEATNIMHSTLEPLTL